MKYLYNDNFEEKYNLACTPMSKLELAQLMLTNQNELSKKQQIDNKQLSSKNRSL